MAKNLRARNREKKAAGHLDALGADDLKVLVRDGLVGMNLSEREDFIREFEKDLKKIGLDVRKYLIPLGIPARKAEDLTPTEVGHVVRYLKINVPHSINAIERTLSRHEAFQAANDGRLAA